MEEPTGGPTPLSRTEQLARGARLRRRLARSGQATLVERRGPDAVSVLVAQNVDRIPSLLSLRRERLSESPFAFFCGAAAVMAADLGSGAHTGHLVRSCGDAHLANFEATDSSDSWSWGLRDYDDTDSAPWEWDLKRLVTSVVVLGRQRGIGGADLHRVACTTAWAYRTEIGRLSRADGSEELTPESDLTTVRPRRAPVVEETGRGYRIRDDPPRTTRLPEGISARDQARDLVGAFLSQAPAAVAASLEPFTFADAVILLSEVACVGTRYFLTLWAGSEGTLLLTFKEAGDSVLAGFVPGEPRPGGVRVVQGQRILQEVEDPFLSSFETGAARSFYVRSFPRKRLAIDVERIDTGEDLAAPASLCGRVLARAHARSGNPGVIAGYLGEGDPDGSGRTVVDRAFAAFADSYARRNAVDHRALVETRDEVWLAASRSTGG